LENTIRLNEIIKNKFIFTSLKIRNSTIRKIVKENVLRKIKKLQKMDVNNGYDKVKRNDN
jgi:hypothetical protein